MNCSIKHILSVGILVLFSLSMYSQTKGINYQAVLVEEGRALSEAPLSIRFTLEEEGNARYQEIHRLNTDFQGMFSAVIGSGEATFGNFSELDWSQTVLDLKVEIDSGNGFREISHKPFQAVPYSLYAEEVGNLPAIELDQLEDVQSASPAVGEILKWDGNAWVPSNDNVASGDGAAVNTNARFTGDGSTDNPLDLAAQGATEGQVLKWNGEAWEPAEDQKGDQSFLGGEGIEIVDDLIVNTGDTDDSDDVKLGSEAGGDLSGLFPNPLVSKLNGMPVSSVRPDTGEVLRWDGEKWDSETLSFRDSPWEQPEEGEVSFIGKIGLNVPNPIFDLESQGNFFHNGFFQVATNTFPAMRIRFNKGGNVSPKTVLQFTISQEQGQGLVEYTSNALELKTIDESSNTTSLIIRKNGRVGINESSPDESLEVNGAIKMGNTTNENAGTIRYTGTDFEGRKGSEWVSLTQSEPTQSSPWELNNSTGEIAYEGGDVKIKGELQQSHTGSANLLPFAYGAFLADGKILIDKSTDNFTVKQLAGGTYQISLSDLSGSEDFLVIANADFSGLPGTLSTELLEDEDEASFTVRTYSLPAADPVDARVSFVVYKK